MPCRKASPEFSNTAGFVLTRSGLYIENRTSLLVPLDSWLLYIRDHYFLCEQWNLMRFKAFSKYNDCVFETGFHLHMAEAAPPRYIFCAILNIFRARNMNSRISDFLFCNVHFKFQVSVVLAFGDMTLFFKSCYDPNDQSSVAFSACSLLWLQCTLLDPRLGDWRWAQSALAARQREV